MANTSASISLRDIFDFFMLKSSSTAKSSPQPQAASSKTARTEKQGKSSKKPHHSVSVIGDGCKVEGNVHFKNDVRIDGILRGDILCESSLIMGLNSSVFGNVQANEITIEGSFEGELRVTQIIRVKKTAVINGELYAPRMSAEYGATINGSCNISGEALSGK